MRKLKIITAKNRKFSLYSILYGIAMTFVDIEKLFMSRIKK
jgi:hypothetical protein